MSERVEKRVVGVAEFIAKDPFDPEAVDKEMRDLMPKIHGVIDWTIHPHGDVTFEYERSPINDALIEEALSGMGFKIRHVCDDPNADEAEVRQALGH
jgi:hypothetical protein